MSSKRQQSNRLTTFLVEIQTRGMFCRSVRRHPYTITYFVTVTKQRLGPAVASGDAASACPELHPASVTVPSLRLRIDRLASTAGNIAPVSAPGAPKGKWLALSVVQARAHPTFIGCLH